MKGKTIICCCKCCTFILSLLKLCISNKIYFSMECVIRDAIDLIFNKFEMCITFGIYNLRLRHLLHRQQL